MLNRSISAGSSDPNTVTDEFPSIGQCVKEFLTNFSGICLESFTPVSGNSVAGSLLLLRQAPASGPRPASSMRQRAKFLRPEMPLRS